MTSGYDLTAGKVNLELAEIVGDHWPTCRSVVARHIPGGVEIGWAVGHNAFVAKTSDLKFVIDDPRVGPEVAYLWATEPLAEPPPLTQWQAYPLIVQTWDLWREPA